MREPERELCRLMQISMGLPDAVEAECAGTTRAHPEYCKSYPSP